MSRGQRIALMAIVDENPVSNTETNITINKIPDFVPLQNCKNIGVTTCTEGENIIIVNNSGDLTVEDNCGSVNLFSKELSCDFSNPTKSLLFDIENLPIDFENTDSSILTEIPAETSSQQSNEIGLTDIIKTDTFQNVKTISQVSLVDYSSSSDSEHFEVEHPLATTKSDNSKVKNLSKKKFKRFDSDYSFYEEKDSDYFYSSSEEEKRVEVDTDNIVGDAGLRKSKKERKKKIRKMENTLGIKRSVQENPCKNKKCQNSCATKLTKQQRHDIFEYYWGLGSYSRQRDWLLSCIKETEVKRRRVNTEYSRRNRTFNYFITWNDQEIEVCQQFILKTLCISQMTLRYTQSNASDKKFAKIDQRGRHDPTHKTSKEDRNSVYEFIKKLPAVPSHYCRASTTKKYLPSELRNVLFLYRVFVKDQLELYKRKTKLSLKVFRQIFNNDFNIGFHMPKKDKCTLCESRKQESAKFTEVEECAYQKHLKDKEESKSQFLLDQNISKHDDSFVCASFDLQKVLNTPHGDNMLLYYSRKYSFYNETIYESGTRNAICYLWGERDGNRGSNEICTIIYKYLENLDERKKIKSVSLYCDSCAGQNKNKPMLGMLYTFLKISKNIRHIKITFLLPGHTYMPVDAVHATIERFINKRIIWAPSEWSTIISNARINPKPFQVVMLKHSDFLSWKSQNILPTGITKTLDGSIFQFNQVKIALFEKGKDEIQVQYSYSDSADILVLSLTSGTAKGKTSRKLKNASNKLEAIYPQPLKISHLKYRDLMQLCENKIIPRQYVEEYTKFVGTAEVPDTLAETDGEDETGEDY